MRKLRFEIPYGEVDGFKFLVFYPEDIQQSWWANHRYYEEEMINFILDNYKGGIFIDVGSSIGNHTTAFSKVADKVHSFEPYFGTFFHQLLNLHANNIKNVEPHSVSLGNTCGTKKFHFDKRSSGGGFTDDERGEYIVPIVKLDDFNFEKITLIKIDVEGYELEVLKGSIKSLKKWKPDIFIECSTEKMLKDVTKILEPLGYKQYEKVFNSTPTYLFSTNLDREFKVRKND